MRPRLVLVPETVGFDDYVAAAAGRPGPAERRQWWLGFRVGAWTVALVHAAAVALLLWWVP